MQRVDAFVALQAPKPVASSAPTRLPLTLADVERWFANAEAGSTLAYHVGFLALDRGAGSRFGEGAGEELDRVAAAVMAMAEAGHVHLVQRRHGAHDYTYLAMVGRACSRAKSRRPARESAS